MEEEEDCRETTPTVPALLRSLIHRCSSSSSRAAKLCCNTHTHTHVIHILLYIYVYVCVFSASSTLTFCSASGFGKHPSVPPPLFLLLCCCCFFSVKAQTPDCPEYINKLLAERKKEPEADSSDQYEVLPCRSVVETLMSFQAFVLLHQHSFFSQMTGPPQHLHPEL